MKVLEGSKCGAKKLRLTDGVKLAKKSDPTPKVSIHPRHDKQNLLE